MQKLIQDGISMFSDLFFQVNRRVQAKLNFKLNSSKKKILVLNFIYSMIIYMYRPPKFEENIHRRSKIWNFSIKYYIIEQFSEI